MECGPLVRLRRVVATRYVTPLREGGSLPALVEADDDGLYVVKLLGAGHGAKALIAELLAGEIGRRLGLPIPELVLVDLDAALAKAEPDQEIQELLERSAGINVGLDFLPGSLPYAPPTAPRIDPELAASIVWFDGLVMNIDRTVRNPNLLVWHRRVWLIDHGVAFPIHHTWRDPEGHARRPFEGIRDHVLLPAAGPIESVDETLAGRIDDAFLGALVEAIPDAWLVAEPGLPDPEAHRAAYVAYLRRRLESPRPFVFEADRARAA